MNSINHKNLAKYIRMTGERAKIDAKANHSYIIYRDNQGRTVKEYYNGDIVVQDETDQNA